MSCFLPIDIHTGVVCLVTTNTVSREDKLIHLRTKLSGWRDNLVRK